MSGGQPDTGRTFVVPTYADGTATVENLATRERAPIAVPALGDRIEAWLADEDPASRGRQAGREEDEQ